jgi:hypothetical protein
MKITSPGGIETDNGLHPLKSTISPASETTSIQFSREILSVNI